ncbi:hypothetical protein [Bacillus sp. FJAT-27251]|uniref:hypothetical protein n=1 Tax=Bacillus sp. FJAT-27251 TaxID=1684142 RepID=UPI0012E1F6F0|nr:hypothetical protein [Bacillus sp. FJAT-27251]
MKKNQVELVRVFDPVIIRTGRGDRVRIRLHSDSTSGKHEDRVRTRASFGQDEWKTWGSSPNPGIIRTTPG